MTSLAERCFGPVRTLEFERIRSLPRCDTSQADLTPVFRRLGGVLQLRPIQSAALWEIEAVGGGFFPIGVGYGKTLIALLAGDAADASRTLIVVPPHLVTQYEADAKMYGGHFRLPAFEVVSCNALSVASGTNLLETLAPNLVVIDEAHYFRRKQSTRTKRLLRYFKGHPETKFVALSGTMTAKGLLDYDHLIKLALREGAPHPYSYHELNHWAYALDVSPSPGPIGVLDRLCDQEDHTHEGNDRTETARANYRCRLSTCRGVVATTEGALGTTLTLQAWAPEAPKSVQAALKELRATWRVGTPETGYEELTDVLAFFRYARQLAQGFYYVWKWPEGQPDRDWLMARADWHREVREYLQRRSKEGYDSPLLLSRAAQAGTIKFRFWEPWAKVRDRYPSNGPGLDTVWIDDYLIKASLEWVKARDAEIGERSIIWYNYDAFGRKFDSACRERGLLLPTFGPGPKASQDILACRADTIAASIAAHGTGKNLQYWNCSLFTDVLNGAAFEQTLGRQHRPGQEADEVKAWVCQQTPELRKAWRGALRDAEYIEQTQGQRQKLLYGNKVGF